MTPTRHPRTLTAASAAAAFGPTPRSHYAAPRSTLLESVLLLICLVFVATTCFAVYALKAESDANKRRHAVEQTQFVCLDGQGKILTHDDFSFNECVPVVFRRADEDGVN